jgi:hypothetical protein
VLATSAQRIPNFLKARSPQGLRRAMLINNTRNNTFYQYFDIQLNPADGFWYAWFYKDVGSEDVAVLERADTGSKKGSE